MPQAVCNRFSNFFNDLRLSEEAEGVCAEEAVAAQMGRGLNANPNRNA